MMQYKNPIISGFYPDPSICRVGEDYFLVTSSFEFFPAIPLFHSKNLVDWEQIGYCVTDSEQFPMMHGNPNASGMYAPTIRYHNGRFYVICTNVTTEETTDTRYGNFIVSTDDPYGEWSDPIWIDCLGIDPSLFFDEDGKVYFCGTNGGVYYCQINPDSGELLSEKTFIWSGTGGCCPEAPHIYRRGNWYYLMIAEGGTEYGHMETIARSRTIEGPYEAYDNNPIISNRSLGLSIMGTGHADIVEDTEGNWWAVCLGFRPITYPPKYNLGRETFLVPMKWNEDGWPIINNNGVITEVVEANIPNIKIEKGVGEPVPKVGEPFEFYDDFSSSQLGLRWTYLYNPDYSRYIRGAQGIDLKGVATTLSEAEVSTFLGFRQQHHEGKVRIKMIFEPRNEGEEAGLAIYLNRNHHYEIALIKQDNVKQLIIRRRIGKLCKIEESIPYDKEEVYLEISASKENYRFGFSSDGEEYTELGWGETKYLTTEAGGNFTGNMYALYATGNGKECENAARICWVRYMTEG